MKYPSVPHDEKKSVKLSLERIELLRELYKKHHNYSLIGRIFGVVPSTVKYWVREDFREKVITDNIEKRLRKMKDPKYRDRIVTLSCRTSIRLGKRPLIIQYRKERSIVQNRKYCSKLKP